MACELIVTDFKLLQPLKQNSGMLVTLFPMVTEVREGQIMYL